MMNEKELLLRSLQIEGLTFNQLVSSLQLQIPQNINQRKGFIGQAIEIILGTTAKNNAEPDFQELGIELKTIPINKQGKPQESTFITTIPLLHIHKQKWEDSNCYKKLKKVLWIPVEGDKSISFGKRRIGRAILWNMPEEDEIILKKDWDLLTNLIVLGKLNEINGTLGEYLQIRPKGQNSRSLCYGYNEEGRKVKTLPRAFYLRSKFTAKILATHTKS